MTNPIANFVLNKQWSLVVGVAGAGLAYILEYHVEDVPVSWVPVLAAVLTWLRVWSKASVDDLVDDVPEESITTIGDFAE